MLLVTATILSDNDPPHHFASAGTDLLKFYGIVDTERLGAGIVEVEELRRLGDGSDKRVEVQLPLDASIDGATLLDRTVVEVDGYWTARGKIRATGLRVLSGRDAKTLGNDEYLSIIHEKATVFYRAIIKASEQERKKVSLLTQS